MNFRVTCNVCKKSVEVKEAYMYSLGFVEMILSCGCKLFLKIERIKQLVDGGTVKDGDE